MKTKVAFFDIDGTVYRDSLLIDHFKMLIKHNFIDMNKWTGEVREKYQRWEKRKGDYDDYLIELVDAYVAALKDIKKEDIDFLSRRVVELKGEVVYRYSREMIKRHKLEGYKVIVISGSPDYLVDKVVEKYNIDDFRASEYVFENGVFTGEVHPMWDSDSKLESIQYFCDKYDIDLENSYAYGDTGGDYTMLKMVGHPVAINPAKRLLDKIQSDEDLMKKIRIIIERKDVIYEVDPAVKTLEH